MAVTEHFDYIIAGAGAAGLSLLHAIRMHPKLAARKILLVDRGFALHNDKTWCFWDDKNLILRNAIHHSWDTLEIRCGGKNGGESFIETLSGLRYYCIQSRKYARLIRDEAGKDDRVTIREADILGFEPVSDGAIIHTSKGTFSADYIFQSALMPPGLADAPVDISLKQHFTGWQIRTEKPVFDPEKATLMDFEIPQMGGVTFFYVLPYNEQEALIEYTIFSGDVVSEQTYRDGLEQYITSRFGGPELRYTVTRSEQGVIPMEDRRYPAWYCDRVLNLGTAGGMTKPSTGYTFSRILRHSAAVVDALAGNSKLPDAAASSYRFRVYDIMILYLLKNDPERAEEIFCDMFRINGFKKVLMFLEEQSHISGELKIFSGLPYGPFFTAIWKMKHRIFTGM